ncbi:MAG: flagellar biosynthesis anti-sigma factor FlgM [Leptospira sp.]|nr:flagellar biosynthesis anti-sigma factor FlgM [Leptospira sp.]
MNIDRVGRIGGAGYEPKKTTNVVKNETSLGSDSVTISDTAKQMSLQARLSQEVANISKQIIAEPESQERSEKLKEVKNKLKNGDYDNLSPEVLDKLSERITEVFLG